MYRRLLVLALGAFAVGTDSFVIAGVLPEVAGSLRVSSSTAGQLITAYALAYAVLSPVMAAVTAHWRRRTVLVTGLAVFIAGTAGSAVFATYAVVLISRAVAGLGGAMVVPTAAGVAAGLVPAHQRGRALAVVLAGLSAATAFGSPLGTALAAATSWRVTLLGVAGLGVVALVGVAFMLPPVPTPPALGLRARLAPLGDRRVASVLATTLLAYAGLFSVYSYIALVLHRATGGAGGTLAALLLVWGIAATVGNLVAGRLSDVVGGYRVALVGLVVATVDIALLRWTGGTVAGAVVVLVVWGLAGWGLLVAQQHRLVAFAPASAPLLIALNSSATYVAVSASGVIGAAAIAWVGVDWLGPIGAVFLAAAVLVTGLSQVPRPAVEAPLAGNPLIPSAGPRRAR